MKKLGLMLVIVMLFVGVWSSTLLAGEDYGSSVKTFRLYNEEWVETGLAKAFRLGPDYESYCNQTIREIPFSVKAEIAQWAHVHMDFTGWNWLVKKPGLFIADSITATLKSNGDLTIGFENFDDLQAVGESVNPTIKTWFAFVGHTNFPGDNQWFRAPNLNTLEPLVIPDSLALHEGREFKLWNRIEVVECNSVGVYEMGGTSEPPPGNGDDNGLCTEGVGIQTTVSEGPPTIVVTLKNQVSWLDANGAWDL